MALPRTSPLYLVLFILAFILAGVGIYMLHQQINKPDDGLAAEYAKLQREVDRQLEEIASLKVPIENWRRTTGFHGPEKIRQYVGQGAEPASDPILTAPPYTLTAAMDSLVNDINRKLTRLRELNQQIAGLRRDVAQARAEVKKAESAGKAKLTELNAQLDEVNAQLARAETEGDKQIAELRRQIATLEDQFRKARQQWAEKRKPLADRLALLEKTAKAMREKLVDATGFQAPADGRVLAVHYDTGRVTINLGRDNYRDITVNSLFDIYGQGKGETEKPKATIKIIKVGPKVSEAVLTEPASGDDNVVVPNDYVEPPIARFRDPKFAIKGYFPANRAYTPEQLSMLVRQYGGKLSEDVEVDTRYLIVGQADPDAEGLDATARAKAREGRDALNRAKQFGVTILTVEKFLDKVGR